MGKLALELGSEIPLARTDIDLQGAYEPNLNKTRSGFTTPLDITSISTLLQIRIMFGNIQRPGTAMKTNAVLYIGFAVVLRENRVWMNFQPDRCSTLLLPVVLQSAESTTAWSVTHANPLR